MEKPASSTHLESTIKNLAELSSFTYLSHMTEDGYFHEKQSPEQKASYKNRGKKTLQLYKSLGAGTGRQLLCSDVNCAESQGFSSGTTVKTLRDEDPQFSAIPVLTGSLLLQSEERCSALW